MTVQPVIVVPKSSLSKEPLRSKFASVTTARDRVPLTGVAIREVATPLISNPLRTSRRVYKEAQTTITTDDGDLRSAKGSRWNTKNIRSASTVDSVVTERCFMRWIRLPLTMWRHCERVGHCSSAMLMGAGSCNRVLPSTGRAVRNTKLVRHHVALTFAPSSSQ